MLLLLAEYLQQFYKGFAVFQYLTLRGILGVLTALVLSLCYGPWMIRTLQNRQMASPFATTARSRTCPSRALRPWAAR